MADLPLSGVVVVDFGQGVAGIVYGRNIIHHPNPKAITRALMAVVHEGTSARDALAHLS